MPNEGLIKMTLPQDPTIEVLVPSYKEPILPVNDGGFGWYGLQAYHIDGSGRLKCHECGEYFDSLDRHVRKHDGLSTREYKRKYGLLLKNRLVSDSLHMKRRSAILDNPILLNLSKERFMKIRELGAKSLKGHKWHWPLESKNKTETCPEQLLRWLFEAAEYYGLDITQAEANLYRSGLSKLLRIQFGSFNKAKQYLRLVTNSRGGPNYKGSPTKYPKELILEDMCCFYSKCGQWPVCKDYRENKGVMLCSSGTLSRYGGIRALRQEAMKLREEQEVREIKGKEAINHIRRDFLLGQPT